MILLPFFILLLERSQPAIPIGDICLRAEEKKLYDLMMEYRKSRGLPPIPLSAKLTLVAKTHARDLVTHYHFDPANECNPHSWSSEGKWSSCCYTNDHSQAACMWNKPKEIAGYGAAGYEIVYWSSAAATAEESLSGWKKSTGHHQLIVNEGTWAQAEWRAVGIAFEKEYSIVWFGEAADETTVSVCGADN